MADESTFNGVALDGDARTAYIEEDRDGDDSEQSRMIRKIQELEESKSELERENRAMKERIGGLTVEVQQLRSDKAGMEESLSEMQTKIEQSECDRKATHAIAARASALESEVCELQEALTMSTVAEEEANAEVSKLRSLFEEKLKDLMKAAEENAALSGKIAQLESTGPAAAKEGIFETDEKETNGLKLQWPAVAAATGAVAAVAVVIYLRSAMRK